MKDITLEMVPQEVKDNIIKNYLIKTFYWTVGFASFIIGFLLGILAS